MNECRMRGTLTLTLPPLPAKGEATHTMTNDREVASSFVILISSAHNGNVLDTASAFAANLLSWSHLTIHSLRRSFSLLLQSMKRYLPFVIVAAVALAALGSGAMLYRAKRPQLLSIPENKSVSGKSGAKSMHIRGNPDAPVTLEEFGDFQ